jgi:hypothetical protein
MWHSSCHYDGLIRLERRIETAKVSMTQIRSSDQQASSNGQARRGMVQRQCILYAAMI